MLAVVHDAQSANESDGTGARSLLDEIVQRVFVRNGYHHEREVLTATGAVRVTGPRVNDNRIDVDTAERQQLSSANV